MFDQLTDGDFLPTVIKRSAEIKAVDRKTGYRTTSILCAPVKLRSGELIGIIQVLNKHDGGFDMDDIMVLEAIAVRDLAGCTGTRLSGSGWYSRMPVPVTGRSQPSRKTGLPSFALSC